MLLFTEEKTRHETMIRKQFIKINRHGKVSLNGRKNIDFRKKDDIKFAVKLNFKEIRFRNFYRPFKQPFIM